MQQRKRSLPLEGSERGGISKGPWRMETCQKGRGGDKAPDGPKSVSKGGRWRKRDMYSRSPEQAGWAAETKGQGESKGPWSWQAEKTKLMSTVIYDTTLWSTERTDLLLKIQDQNRWLKNKNPQYHRDLLKSNHFITCYYCLFSCRSWVMILCAFNVYVHKHNFCSVLRSLTRKRNRGSHVSSLVPQSWWHGGMGGVACLFVFNYSLE